MRAYIDEYCDNLDASVFSGDAFQDRKSIKEFREYMARWERGLKEHEGTLDEIEKEKSDEN